MKASKIAIAAIAAFGLSAAVASAQEAGFGNDPNASKNQVPAPSVNNPADPAAGNPGSAAQVPTAPQKQEDLYDSGASGAGTGEAGSASDPAMTKPQTSDPAR
ncbi:MAG TPA: hypothetical protein VNR51_01135 [Hyphomicrobium sp.]|nr:hypothetical protein [Hyphomicrobium sp.]